MTISEIVQQPALDGLVTLFILDCTALGGPVLRFTPGPIGGVRVEYQGEEYQPLPIEAEGFEWNAQGPLPRPKLRGSNIENVLGMVIIGLGDIVGATVTRLRTFARFLDGAPDADPAAHFEPDIWRVERKTRHDPEALEWELASVLDQEGVMLPRLTVLRDVCTHTYRRWTGADFDYEGVTCPYVGAASFNEAGAAVGAAADRCGRRLGDCKLRFGNDPLPTRAFPGVPRVPA